MFEVRVFTGRDATGRPTQVSRTVRGTKRDARRVAAQLESHAPSHAAGRTVADVLSAWREVNDTIWSVASVRDYRSRARLIAEDVVGRTAIARLGVGDVERWHSRMRHCGVGESAIRSRHAVLRSALSQAVRWGWVGTNVAAAARLKHAKRSPRTSMADGDVRAVISAAESVDPAAGLALRLAAITGARRSELAALQWRDFDVKAGRLRIDSSIVVLRGDGQAGPTLVDAPTKTADFRLVHLDEGTETSAAVLRAQREGVSPYLFSLTSDPPNPDRIGWWWRRARSLSGIDAKWRLHDLRHWSATTAIGRGHDLRTVAGRLGHANPAMTLRTYAHLLSPGDEAVAETLGDALT